MGLREAGTKRLPSIGSSHDGLTRTVNDPSRQPYLDAGATYELTGPTELTLEEVAAVLSRHLGREVRFHDESLEEAYRSREQYGAPRWQVDARASTYTAFGAGELERVTRDVERVSGHPPATLAEVLARGPAVSG